MRGNEPRHSVIGFTLLKLWMISSIGLVCKQRNHNFVFVKSKVLFYPWPVHRLLVELCCYPSCL